MLVQLAILSLFALVIWTIIATNLRENRFSAFLLCLTCVSQFIFVETRISVIPIRWILGSLCFAMYLLKQTKTVEKSKLQYGNKVILFCGLMYSSWLLLCSIANSEPVASLVDDIRETASNIFVPASILLLANRLSHEKEAFKTASVLLACCGLVVASTGIIACLQYFGVEQLLQMQRDVFPATDAKLRLPDGSINHRLPVPGLSAYSIALSYEVTILGSIITAFALFPTANRSKLIYGLALVTWIVTAAAVAVAKSRSGLVAIVLIPVTCYLLFYLKGRALHSNRDRPSSVSAAIVLVLTATFVAIVLFPALIEDRAKDLGRLSRLSDAGRVSHLQVALNVLFENPLTGIGMERFVDLYKIEPHNALVNAGIEGGLPGVLLALAGYVALIVHVLQLCFNKRVGVPFYISVGLASGVVVGIWHGMSHNMFLVTNGLPYITCLLSVGVLGDRSYEQQGQIFRTRSAVRPF